MTRTGDDVCMPVRVRVCVALTRERILREKSGGTKTGETRAAHDAREVVFSRRWWRVSCLPLSLSLLSSPPLLLLLLSSPVHATSRGYTEQHERRERRAIGRESNWCGVAAMCNAEHALSALSRRDLSPT